MALVVVNTASPEPIATRQEYVHDDVKPRVTLPTGEVNGQEVYLLLPYSVGQLEQEVVILSLEAVRIVRGGARYWRIGWVQPWRRKEVDHIDLLLFMERDDIRISYSPSDARGYAHIGYHTMDADTVCFGIRIDLGTTLKVESMTGGETYYFAARQDEDGRPLFSRPSAEEAELDAKWTSSPFVFRRAK